MKFLSVAEAEKWAKENNKSGVIVAVNIDGKWIAHMVEEDHSVTPICNCNGEQVVINLIDGGDADGYHEEEDGEIIYWDGGTAAGYK